MTEILLQILEVQTLEPGYEDDLDDDEDDLDIDKKL